jgi:hypothetical protein
VRKFRGHGKCSQFWKNTANWCTIFFSKSKSNTSSHNHWGWEGCLSECRTEDGSNQSWFRERQGRA